MLQPVGPRPPHVYWVRRLVLLALVTVFVIVGVHGCSGGPTAGSPPLGQRADQRPLTPTSSASPSATPAAAGPVVACRAQDLRVAVSPDATDYPLGVNPRFTAVLSNAGPTCRFPTALSSRSWRILSGVDEVWATADCPRSDQGKTVRLGAGRQVTYVLPWDRHRSTPGCALEGTPAQPGTYRLYVTIDGAVGHPAVFHLAG